MKRQGSFLYLSWTWFTFRNVKNLGNKHSCWKVRHVIIQLRYMNRIMIMQMSPISVSFQGIKKLLFLILLVMLDGWEKDQLPWVCWCIDCIQKCILTYPLLSSKTMVVWLTPHQVFTKSVSKFKSHFSECWKWHQANTPRVIGRVVLQECVEANVFESLNGRMFNSSCFNNHLLALIKCCSLCFRKIRMHHLGKQCTVMLQAEAVRKRLSKLILFKHQWRCYM